MATSAASVSTLRRQLPNTLTIVRVIIATLFFVILSLRRGGAVPVNPDPGLVWAMSLFIVAALTDILDGYLSRRWRVTSRFGRVMDPFADKVLIVGSFVFLAGPAFRATLPDGTAFQISGVTPWMAVVILARELLVTSIRGVVESSGRSFAADAYGKVKMFAQSVAVPTIIGVVGLFSVLPGSTGRAIVDAFAWGAVLITAASAIPYLIRGARALRELPFGDDA